ncbi:hypothetical protein VCSRO62_2986 [Vibrio cholerae]|nr:hypothetical protein VCSRO156_3235 [Vibrio cholerae]GHX39219.1 hypothetical protein VCSRO62_2986 [Vibrio cholerae]GHY14044.1 hypothetical protein VCSRO112_3419 [Vibrio cholerae]
MRQNSTLVAHLQKSKSRVESWPTWKQEQSGTQLRVKSDQPTPSQSSQTRQPEVLEL